MHRLFTVAITLVLTGTLMSCSAPESTVEQDAPQQEAETSPHPSWYQQQTIVDTDSLITAYTAAIDSDSASSVSKAVEWAETELSSSVAAQLEEIRAEAEESGETMVSAPEFLVALANSDVISELASTVNTEVETVEGFTSHRSYVEVQVQKAELLEAIEQELSAYKKAWNAMKESQAFNEFSQ